MSSTEIFTETEVTIENVNKIFKRAFFSTSLDSDGDLLVQSDGPRVIVKIDSEKKHLCFMTLLRIKESAPEITKLSLVNDLNNKTVLARFSVPRPHLIAADYTLPFEEGIPTFQIVSTLRLFSRVIANTVHVCDEHDIVL